MLLSAQPVCSLDLAWGPAVCGLWLVSGEEPSRVLATVRKAAGAGRGWRDAHWMREVRSPLPPIRAASISEAPHGPAWGGEPGGSASDTARQVQAWVSIKGLADPGGADWAQMLPINGLTWWGGAREGGLPALFVAVTQGR